MPPLPRAARLTALALLLAAAPGCAALYFIGGQGSQPALYTLPKNQRVLVFVDPRANVSVSPDFPSALGDKIGKHLFKYSLADKIIPQERLTALRRDHEKFATMGIADVAHACEAQLVIHVDVIACNVDTLSDNSIAQGNATVLVKVTDGDGQRLWPKNSPLGTETAAQVDPAFTTDRDEAGVAQQLTDVLAMRIGRMFQTYDKEDPLLSK